MPSQTVSAPPTSLNRTIFVTVHFFAFAVEFHSIARSELKLFGIG
jgi:hypothetical protein